MKRVAAHIVIAVPAQRCMESVQAAMSDERIHAAYRELRAGKEYSGWVSAITPGRWLEIRFAALDPATGRRAHSFGWRVTYDFLPVDGNRTRVEIAVEYGALTALAGAGTTRAQAENEVAHRIAAMHALEAGFTAPR